MFKVVAKTVELCWDNSKEAFKGAQQNCGAVISRGRCWWAVMLIQFPT